jgi:hypothetical protein
VVEIGKQRGIEGAAVLGSQQQCVYSLPAAGKAVSAKAGLPPHALEYAVRVLCDPSTAGKGISARTTSMVYAEMKPIRDLFLEAFNGPKEEARGQGGRKTHNRYNKLKQVRLL